MTTSVRPTLRPLGLGELLDQAIRLYRRNFLTFVGIIAIVPVPLSIVQLVTSLLTVQDLANEIVELTNIGTLLRVRAGVHRHHRPAEAGAGQGR